MTTKRAGEESFDELHSLLTNEIISRIKLREATRAALRASIAWLATNDISGVVF